MLSKETLDVIRKVTSAKQTPGAVFYGSSKKRINSEKPTPTLPERKIYERSSLDQISQRAQ
jgi:hypothetical protein